MAKSAWAASRSENLKRKSAQSKIKFRIFYESRYLRNKHTVRKKCVNWTHGMSHHPAVFIAVKFNMGLCVRSCGVVWSSFRPHRFTVTTVSREVFIVSVTVVHHKTTLILCIKYRSYKINRPVLLRSVNLILQFMNTMWLLYLTKA